MVDVAVVDATVADATVADVAVADATLQIETVSPCVASARKRSCQACRADTCLALSPWRLMLRFSRKFPTPLPNWVLDATPLCVAQNVQTAKPLLHPGHGSCFCDTGLRYENSALHCYLFPELARATRGNVRLEIVARDVLCQRPECMCLKLLHLARLPNLLSLINI